eukprot:EG_transcript_19111
MSRRVRDCQVCGQLREYPTDFGRDPWTCDTCPLPGSRQPPPPRANGRAYTSAPPPQESRTQATTKHEVLVISETQHPLTGLPTTSNTISGTVPLQRSPAKTVAILDGESAKRYKYEPPAMVPICDPHATDPARRCCDPVPAPVLVAPRAPVAPPRVVAPPPPRVVAPPPPPPKPFTIPCCDPDPKDRVAPFVSDCGQEKFFEAPALHQYANLVGVRVIRHPDVGVVDPNKPIPYQGPYLAGLEAQLGSSLPPAATLSAASAVRRW